jgi:hypothetical protein
MKIKIPGYTSEKPQVILLNYRQAGYHRPLAHYRYISLATFLVLFVAFLLFLLVALSVPIIKTVYILKFTALANPNQPQTDVATTLKFGVWGLCATRCVPLRLRIACYKLNLHLSTLSVLDGPNNFGRCYGPKLGYTVPADVIALAPLAGISTALVDILLHAVVVLLVLHPVAAGLSFWTFINSLFLGHHAVSIVALILSVVTALLSTIVFAIDLALVLIAKSKVKSITVGHFAVDWGNAVWMVLVATILTWVAVILLSARACYCCGVRR